MGKVFGEALLVEENTVKQNRFDRGKVLILVPHGKDCVGRLEVVVDKKVFQVSVEVDKSPIELKWLEDHLGLDSNEGGSSSIPFQESQFKSRGYFANVPSTNSSSSARVVEYGKKVSIIQRSSSDIPEREVVPFETRQGRKVNTGLTNLSHIKGHPEKSSVGVLCQGRKEKGKKVWLRRPKKDDFWGREGERILKGNCSKTGHIGSQVNSGPIQTEQGNGPVQTVQKKVGSNLSSGSKSSQSRMDRSCYEISKEGQLWVEIGPNQKSTAFKSSILEKPPLEEVEQSTNEEQSLRSKETAEDSPKQTWNLEVEITKVIEQGVAIGYNFNRRAREEESESEGEEEDLNMEEGEVQATVVTKSKGRKKTQAVKKHGMQTRNTAIRQSQDQANSLNLTQQKRRPKLSWNLEDEIAKVIETGVALGFNFNNREKEIGEEIARRELEDKEKMDLVN
ncbi:hypothetical protein Q3G72_004588 [Acer saccharum]|nr:hypothetical protein Q3G72_004588 [Acer saccharum]